VQELWRDLIRKRATRIPWLRLATEELWLSVSLAKANKMDITCFSGIVERCSTSYRHPHRPPSVPQHARYSGISEMRRDTSRSDAIEEKRPFPCLHHKPKHEKPRGEASLGSLIARPRGKNNRQTFFPLLYGIPLQSICQHSEMSPAPSTLPSVMS
jgi:hypothetical protein